MVFDKKCNIKQQKWSVLKGFWRLFFEIASYLFLPEHENFLSGGAAGSRLSLLSSCLRIRASVPLVARPVR